MPNDVGISQWQQVRSEVADSHPLVSLIPQCEIHVAMQMHRAAIDDPRKAVQLPAEVIPQQVFFYRPRRQQTLALSPWPQLNQHAQLVRRRLVDLPYSLQAIAKPILLGQMPTCALVQMRAVSPDCTRYPNLSICICGQQKEGHDPGPCCYGTISCFVLFQC